MSKTWFLFALMFLVAACNGEGPEKAHEEGDGDDHAAHEAKHGGEVVVLGAEKAHAEVKCDRHAGKLMLWTYDEHMEPASADAAPVLNMVFEDEVKQLAATGEGSEWVFADATLETEAKDWSLRLSIGGVVYTPKLPHLECTGGH